MSYATNIYGRSVKVAGASKRQWKTIQLPDELLQRVDGLVAVPGLGYTSRAEFVKEAVRLRVETMENLLREKARRA